MLLPFIIFVVRNTHDEILHSNFPWMQIKILHIRSNFSSCSCWAFKKDMYICETSFRPISVLVRAIHCLFGCLVVWLIDFYFYFKFFQYVLLHGVTERLWSPYVDRYDSHCLERVNANSEGRSIKEGRGCKKCKYMTRKGNQTLLQRCEANWSRLVLPTTDFCFKFGREEHWLQLLEWRCHIWMIMQIFIQIHTHLSKCWRFHPQNHQIIIEYYHLIFWNRK